MVQVCSGADAAVNLRRIDGLLAAAPAADIIALPEVFGLRGTQADYRAGAEPLDGPTAAWAARLAASRGCWVLAGSLIERAGGRVYNTGVLFNRSGGVAATYRKIHLFEARLEDGTCIRERDAYEPGDRPVYADIEGWRAGLAICYDLRFPELFRGYSREGASLMFVPSDFTQRTGKDHWEVLLRARAIENQCFVVAPDQCGPNRATGVPSYGHSLVVGPWGEVLCDAGIDEGVRVVELDPQELTRTRERVPALRHRTL